MNTPLKTDILILGAGIGGYETFRTLAKLLKKQGSNKIITIVDRNNYFTFAPLLHEVASGAVEPSHCTLPLREIVYQTPHKFIKTEVRSIDPVKKVVTTGEGEISYDYCVAGLGSGVNYFGVPGADTHCYGVRTLDQAMRLRETIIKKLEDHKKDHSITVVGGGFSGVEVAGQLASLVGHDFKKLYPTDTVTVNLVESGKTVVPVLPLSAQNNIIKHLKKMGVKMYLNTTVQNVSKETITFKDNTQIASDITVWCAGIGNVATKFLPAEYCERGRLPVTESLLSIKTDTLYGVGDIVLGHNVGSDAFFPQLGEAAHMQGEYIARHIAARLKGKTLKPFYFKSKGILMPIGDGYGVAVFGKFVLTGLFAWWLRRTVYVLFMPGITRKLKIISDWTLRLFGFNYIIAVERMNSVEK